MTSGFSSNILPVTITSRADGRLVFLTGEGGVRVLYQQAHSQIERVRYPSNPVSNGSRDSTIKR
jgi:8-oxo-dGTP diphosphatase